MLSVKSVRTSDPELPGSARYAFDIDVVHWLFPTLPVVGYEYGDDLAAAACHGFEPVGPLRI